MPKKSPLTWQKMVNYYKEVANNPEASPDIWAKNAGISRSMGYAYLEELKTAWAVTSDDTNFPRKLLLLHNHHLPAGADQLNDDDVDRLKPLITAQLTSKEQAATGEMPFQGAPMMDNSFMTMGDSPKSPDVGTNENLLRAILMKMRYVSPATIERFLDNYRLGEEDFERNPSALLNFMRHMFGPGQGESAFQLFKSSQGKYVDSGMAGNNFGGGPQMDPMLMMAMMGGGNMSAILPMLMQSGQRMDPMIMMMLNQQQQREQQKRDQQDMMDRAMQISMLKLVGGSMEDRNPMNPYMMGMGGMGMPGWQIQEVLDSNGKVTGRTLVPASPGMMGQSQSNPIVEIVLKNALERENLMMQQSMNANKPINDLFMNMIANFKSNSNPVEQLSQLRVAFPDLFERKQDPGSMNLDVYKLKFDTDLAMMAQKIELKKMDHQWKMEQLDRESQNESAKNWMGMIETFGEKLGAPVASALIQGGMGGMAPGMGGPPGMMPGVQQRMGNVVATVPPEAMVPPPPKKPDPLVQSMIATPNPGPDPAVMAVAVQQEQQTRQMQSIMLQMQQEIERVRSDNRKLTEKLQKTPTRSKVDPMAIKKLPTSTLKEALLEYSHEQSNNEEIGKLLQTELANRELYGKEDASEEEDDDLSDIVESEDEEGDDDLGDVNDDEARNALDEDDLGGPTEGVSTKPMQVSDANNAIDGGEVEMPSEIARNYDTYKKVAKQTEDPDELDLDT